MLLKAERREMDARAEDLSLGQDTDSTDAVDLHLHIGIAIWVAQVSKVRPPRRILCVSLDDDGVFIESVGEGQGSLGLLPRVEIVRLLSSKPVWQWAPHVWGLLDYILPVTRSKRHSLGTMTSLLWRIRSSKIENGAVSTSTSLQYTQEWYGLSAALRSQFLA